MRNEKMSAKGGSQPKADQPMAGAKNFGGKTKLNIFLLAIVLGIGMFLGGTEADAKSVIYNNTGVANSGCGFLYTILNYF